MERAPQESLREVCCDLEASRSDVAGRIKAIIGGGESVHSRDKNGVTPLHFAARFRNAAATRELLANGAEVNVACSRSRSTHLHRAISFTGAPGTAGRNTERLDVIRILLESGADPLAENASGKVPADYASDPDALELLNDTRCEHGGDGRPATAPEWKPEGNSKPKSKSERRSQ